MIEPYSVRGEIDLIADQRGMEPKYIEGKIFDNGQKGKFYLQAAFHQLFTYLCQYKAPAGYLAVYKFCKEKLTFDLDGAVQTVPFVSYDNKTIYVVVIDLFPYDDAVSQRGALRTVQLTKEDLVQQIGS